ALPSQTATSQIAAALLMYRLIYYFIPFALSLLFLAMHATWQAAHKGRRPARPNPITLAIEPAMRALAPLAPLVLAFTTFGAGLWMTASALLPPMTRPALTLFPLAVMEGSALLS